MCVGFVIRFDSDWFAPDSDTQSRAKCEDLNMTVVLNRCD